MFGQTTTPPVGVALLADHLDGALAAGEDLLAVTLAPQADAAGGDAADVRLGKFVTELRRHEAALLLRLLQARRRAAAIVTQDQALRSVLKLIGASTDALLDLVGHYGDKAVAAAAHGDDLQHYLRQRGLIADDAPAVGAFDAVRVSDAFRVGGMVPLGGLLDMTSAALDLLDRQFNLYSDLDDETEAADATAATAEDVKAALGALKAAAGLPIAPVEAEKPEAGTVAEAKADDTVDGDSPTSGSLRAALDELNRAT